MTRGRKPGTTREVLAGQRLAKEQAERSRQKSERQQANERLLQATYAAVPQPHRANLQYAILQCALGCFNNLEVEKGDGLLAMLPTDIIMKFVDWYFDDRQPSTMPRELNSEGEPDAEAV